MVPQGGGQIAEAGLSGGQEAGRPGGRGIARHRPDPVQEWPAGARDSCLRQINAFTMGALMMHFMLETILMGKLMGVDPFNQPGVEEGKVLARQYLAEG